MSIMKQDECLHTNDDNIFIAIVEQYFLNKIWAATLQEIIVPCTATRGSLLYSAIIIL